MKKEIWKKGKRRLLALLLTVIMVLQQSTLPVVSAETTQENAAAVVQETESQEIKTTEAKAPETTTTEAKAPEATTEAKAPETTTTEAKAPEATTEAKAPETTTTEAKAPEATTEAKAPEATTTEAKAPETTTEVTAPVAKVPVVKAPAKGPRATGQNYEMKDFITSVVMKIKATDGKWYTRDEKDGKWYTGEGSNKVELPEGVTFDKDAPVDVKILYNPEGTQFAIGEEGKESTITYQLPDGIKVHNAKSGDVIGNGGAIAGGYEIDTNGHITITLNPQYLEKYDGYLENGSISFSGSLNAKAGSEGGKEEIIIGKDQITVPITPEVIVEKGVINITKEVVGDNTIQHDKDGYYIPYQITVSTPTKNDGFNTMDMTGVTVEDIFKNLEYVNMKDGKVDIFDIGNHVGTVTATENGFSWTGIPDMPEGTSTSYTLTFKVRIKDTIDDLEAVKDERQVINTAVVKSGDVTNDATVTTQGNANLGITKENAGYIAEDGTVTYTVKVTAPSNNTVKIPNVTVDDVFGTNSNFVEKYKSISADPTKGFTFDNKNKKLHWNIGTMNPGDSKTLTYTVKIDKDIFLQSNNNDTQIDNIATLKVKDNYKGEASSTVEFSESWIKKNGEWEKDGNGNLTGRVKFTIKAKTPDKTLSNNPVTFTDMLQGDWVYDGSLEVVKKDKDRKDGTVDKLPDINGKTSWTWPDENVSDGPYTYTFTYYARYTGPDLGRVTVKNGAGMNFGVGDGKDQNYSFDDEFDSEQTGTYYDSLTKRFAGREGNIANWESKITCTVPAGAIYSDWRKDGEGHYWEFTDAQIFGSKDEPGVVVTAEGRTLEAGADKDYTIRRDGTGFKIEFLKEIKASEDSPILITYSCTLKTDDVKETESTRYWNKSNLVINGHTDTADADCTFIQEQLIKKTPYEYNSQTGEISWQIKVNATGSMEGEAVVKDELPDGLEYVSAEITGRGEKAAKANTAMTVAVADQLVVMKLTGLVKSDYDDDKVYDDAFVTITLKTKVVLEGFYISGSEYTFTNTAEILYGNVTKSSEAKETITNKILSKTGEYKAPDILYQIVINEDGHDMLDGVDTINVTDTMGTDLMLREDTLKITNSAGKNVPIQNLRINGNVFSFDVPDNEKLIVTYRAYVIGAVGTTPEDATNTVVYTGYVDVPGSEWDKPIIIQESEAGIQGQPAIFVEKKDFLNGDLLLANAEFTLYEVDADGKETEIDRDETDSKGSVKFTGLNKEKVYAIHETKAPDGYYIDNGSSTKKYVAFSENEIYTALHQKGYDVKIYLGSVTFPYHNKKAQIAVTKDFADINGAIPNGLYYFGLFDENKVLVKDQVKSIEIKNGKYLIANNGTVLDTITFENVDVGTDDGKAKTYYVYETDRDGKIIPKNMDGTILVNGGRFEVSGDGKVVVSEKEPDKIMKITNTEKPLQVGFVATKQLLHVADTTNLTFDFGLYNEEGELIDTAHNDRDGKIAFEPIPYTRKDTGKTYTYTMKEIVPDGKDGIIYDTTEYKVVVTVSHETATGLTVSVKVNDSDSEIKGYSNTSGVYEYALPNQKDAIASFVNTFAGSAKLTKTDSDDKVLADAEFELYREVEEDDPVLVDKFVTGEDGIVEARDLVEGSYYFVETKAPVGYAIKMDKEGNPKHYPFEIGPNGGKQAVDYACEVVNEHIKFNVNKVELDNTKEVAGAELTVYGKDEAGKFTVEIDKWVSKEGETHEFGAKLEAGKDYILRETKAPEGYAYTFDIAFKVEADGTITTSAKKVVDDKTKEVTYLVEDDITRMTILKVDEEGNGVAGARLALKDEAGKLITNEDGSLKYSWVTTGEPHPLGGISAGNYILTELEAPEGYEVADDVVFTLDDTAGAVNEVVMVDKKTPDTSKGSLTVTKKVELKGHEDVIINLDEATFYVALFSDEARTHRISNVKPIVFKNQQASEVVFENLAAGTYYVGETDAYGKLLENGYWKEVEFNPVYGDGYAAKLESNTFAAQVYFKNVFEEGPDGAFYEGMIDITKEVLKDGKAYNTDEVYYAGIFYDEEYTDLLEKVELAMDGKSSTTVSVQVPLGTDLNEKVKFYVTEVDKHGKPLKNGPNLGFKVTVKDGNVVMSVDEPKAAVEITNAYETKITKPTKAITKGAKTGDDMNLWGTIALLILSTAGILVILFRRRKYTK